MPLFFFSFSIIVGLQIKTKTFFNTFLIKGQRVVMSLINRPFKLILNDYVSNQAGVIMIIALFCMACNSLTDCFTPSLCLLMTRVTTSVNDNLIN